MRLKTSYTPEVGNGVGDGATPTGIAGVDSIKYDHTVRHHIIIPTDIDIK